MCDVTSLGGFTCIRPFSLTIVANFSIRLTEINAESKIHRNFSSLASLLPSSHIVNIQDKSNVTDK